MGFIMPMSWRDRPVFEFFGPHFVLNAQGLAADLGATYPYSLGVALWVHILALQDYTGVRLGHVLNVWPLA